MGQFRKHFLGVGAALVLLCLIASAGWAADKPTIRLADTQFQSLWVNNAIAKFVIEHGYGYPVEYVQVSRAIEHAAFPKGEIDLDTEMWQQNFMEWYTGEIKKGTIVNLGMTYEAGPQFWVVPQYTAEKYNLKTVFDMKDHWKKFPDPENPSKGIFYNCPSGWGCHGVNWVKMEAYGLDKYYTVADTGSGSALKAALAAAQKKKKDVFGYYWAPTDLIGMYDWYILEEPGYTKEVWDKVHAAYENKDLRPIDEACAYPADSVDKVCHIGLFTKAPDVVAMLTRMVVGLDPLNKVLAWTSENDIQDYEKTAVRYLRNYEDRWQTWVTEDAYKKVKAALAKMP